MSKRLENLSNKSIDDFIPGEDTMYISKMSGGCQIIYLCRFVSCNRGIVTGDVISYDPNWAHNKYELEGGIQVRARLSKCFLFGIFDSDTNMNWSYCHWFNSKTKKVNGAQ